MSEVKRGKVVLVARVLLGLVFFVFGLNGFLHFMPIPPQAPEGTAFLGALAKTKYMFPFIKGTEVLAGLLLLSGFFVPLALLLLAPVLLNILAFHLFLSTVGLAGTFVFVALELFLAWSYRDVFAHVLKAKN